MLSWLRSYVWRPRACPATLCAALEQAWLVDKSRPLWARRGTVGKREDIAAGGGWLTYDDMFRRAAVIADALRADKSSLIGVCLPLTAEWVATDLACALTCATSVPLDTSLSVRELRELVKSSGVTTVVCSVETAGLARRVAPEASFVRLVIAKRRSGIDHKRKEASQQPRCDSVVREIEINKIGARGAQVDMTEAFRHAYKDEAALSKSNAACFTLQPTSGTTGLPKLLRHTREGWLRSAWGQQQRGDKTTHMLALAGLSAAAPRTWLWNGLLSGGSFAESSPHTILEDCQHIHPTSISAPGSVWDLVVQQAVAWTPTVGVEGASDNMSTLFGPRCRAITNTGSAISTQTLQQLCMLVGKHNVYDGYGSSETGGIAVNGRLLPGVEVR